jgi:hypothetical protein
MSQDTDGLLSQIAKDIDAKELEKTSKINKRVGDAYGADGRGLILPTQVQVEMPAKPDDLY